MLYIVRHGQTELNHKNLLQGRSNKGLNEAGIQQAENIRKLLKQIHPTWQYVFSSPLLRAVQTAQIIAPDTPITTDERLLEMDYGPYEGADLKNPPSELTVFFKDFVHNPAPSGMETLEHVVERAGIFLEEMKGLDGDILISTHAILMKGILEYLTPESRGKYWSQYLGNCAVYWAEMDKDEIKVPLELTRGF